MKNNEAIFLKRYQELILLCEQYKELYRELEKRYKNCECFHCKMRLVTLGMEIVSLNSVAEQMERDLLPPIEEIFNSMSINFTIEDGKIKLSDQ